jgi:hypothetical protein
MARILGLIFVFIGVVGNNIVYLQDLLLGQGHISLDGWLAYSGIIVSVGFVIVGCILMLWRQNEAT